VPKSTPQKIVPIVFLCLGCLLNVSSGQTAQQLAARFPAVAAYQIRPKILMLSKFDSKGQICEAIVEPLREGARSKTQRLVMSEKLADELLQEIVPNDSRGASLSPFLDPDSEAAGGVYLTKTNFELVSIEKMGNFPQDAGEDTIQVLRITWTKRTCGNKDE
jgi:hypothetical protein